MYASEITWSSHWWIVPVIMMVLCFLMMRGRWGSMMCGFGPRNMDGRQNRGRESALEILDRRYASGEMDTDEYEERKRTLAGSAESKTDNA